MRNYCACLKTHYRTREKNRMAGLEFPIFGNKTVLNKKMQPETKKNLTPIEKAMFTFIKPEPGPDGNPFGGKY